MKFLQISVVSLIGILFSIPSWAIVTDLSYVTLPEGKQPLPSPKKEDFQASKTYFINASHDRSSMWTLVTDSKTGFLHLMKTCSTTYTCTKEATLMLMLQGKTLPVVSLNSEQHFFVTGPFQKDHLPVSLIDETLQLDSHHFLDMAIKMAKVIEHVHKAKVLHLELTLGSWITSSQRGSVELIEFSNAKLVGDTQKHDGSMPDIAPEIRQENSRYSEKSDIWGLGMAYYNIWTMIHSPLKPKSFLSAIKVNGKKQDKSKHPELVESDYLEKNIIPLTSWFPKELKRLIRKMTDTDPSNRPNIQKVLSQLSLLDLTSKTPSSSVTVLTTNANLPKSDLGSFNEERYRTLPTGVSVPPLLKEVVGANALDQGQGGEVFTARIVCDGVSDQEVYAVKHCRNSIKCRKEMVMLSLLRGLDVTTEIVAQNPEKALYAMELLHGDPLRRIDGLSKKMFLPIAIRMAQIMVKVHSKGILHLDMGFGNWFYDEEKSKIFLIDFGHARFVDDPKPYHAYVNSSAPENRQLGVFTPASEVWALGMGYYTLWTMMHKAMTTKTFQAAIKKNVGILRIGHKEAVDKFYETSELPFPSYFPQTLIDLISLMTSHDPSKRPTLNVVLTKLAELALP